MTRKPLNRGKLGGIGAALESTPARQVGQSEEKVVNMNFKAPEASRRHWKVEAAKRGEDLSSVIRAYLAERYGLPRRDSD